MKTFRPSRGIQRAHRLPLVAVGIALLACKLHAGDKTDSKSPPAAAKPVAAFRMPNSLNEGRDPFYPSSTRVIAASRPIEKAAPGPATLELKGISGTTDQPLAIINNRTFAVGEKDYITTAEGRVSVECLAIEGTRVRVAVQGQTRELVLRKGI